ncbi:hypothetical protein D9615_004592 [Tricholomella constricta]|uniref:Uncharacterized protein n=1 Tax=Tricholomella constricta TaxID=117010 RepID=A0A8H5M4J6_9AGAR|nr:hypothetical protein D9615_004592 [Tricholomella constricta]
MPSYTTILKSVLFLGASAACAAPLASVGTDVSAIGRRHGGFYILGVSLDDPCATLRLMMDHNRECRQTDELRLFDDLLGGYCEADGDRMGGFSSLLETNLNILGRSSIKDAININSVDVANRDGEHNGMGLVILRRLFGIGREGTHKEKSHHHLVRRDHYKSRRSGEHGGDYTHRKRAVDGDLGNRDRGNKTADKSVNPARAQDSRERRNNNPNESRGSRRRRSEHFGHTRRSERGPLRART